MGKETTLSMRQVHRFTTISKAYQQQENAHVSRIIDRCKSTKIANSAPDINKLKVKFDY